MKKCLFLSILVLPFVCGCGWAPFALKEAVAESITLRRCVVGNDWVYVKKTDTLYRRYIPSKGIGPLCILKGNKELLANVDKPHRKLGFLERVFKGPFDGKIMLGRHIITVYGNYEKALQAHPNAKISPESQKFVPAKKKTAPEWWLRQRKAAWDARFDR